MSIQEISRSVILTLPEASAFYGLINTLSGGNPSGVFAWDGTDDLNDPTTSVMAKIFDALGQEIPENLR